MREQKKDKLRRSRELSAYEDEIRSIRNSLDEAYAHFNTTTDPDALDACIFEISALRAKYNTALKHYRERYY